MYAYIHIHVLIFIYVHKFLPVVPTVAPLQTKDSWIQRERDYKRRDREWGDGASARVSAWKRQSACARARERGRERHRAKVRGRARERERNRKGERGRLRECERERARGELGRRRRNGGEQQRGQSGRGYNWIVRGSNRQDIWGNVTRMNLSVKTHWMTLFSKISLLYRVTPMHESCHTCGGVMSHTWSSLSDFVKHCNTLQHTATHCNTLQHIATHCNTLPHTTTHMINFVKTSGWLFLDSNWATNSSQPRTNHVSHVEESRHTDEHALSHVTCMNKLVKSCWWFFGFKLSLITPTNESRHTCGRVTSHRQACSKDCHTHDCGCED